MIGAGGVTYDLGARAQRCHASGADLRPGDRYVAVLVEVPGPDGTEPTLARRDYTEQAWSAHPLAPGERVFAKWVAVVPERTGRKSPRLGDDELLDLFLALDDAEDRSRQTFRYLLALMLIRRKKLLLDGSRPATGHGATLRPGELQVRVRRPAGEPMPLVRVVDPGLSTDELEAAAAQLDTVTQPDAGAGPDSGAGQIESKATTAPAPAATAGNAETAP